MPRASSASTSANCSSLPGRNSYAPGLPTCSEVALRAGHVEHRAQLAVAAGLLVVRRDAVPHELAEHEDRRLHVERHRVVLERRAVTVAHQVVDEAAVAGRGLGAGRRRLERLLALRRDSRGEQHVGVGGARSDELDRHVAAELDLGLCGRGVIGHASHITGVRNNPVCYERDVILEASGVSFRCNEIP